MVLGILSHPTTSELITCQPGILAAPVLPTVAASNLTGATEEDTGLLDEEAAEDDTGLLDEEAEVDEDAAEDAAEEDDTSEEDAGTLDSEVLLDRDWLEEDDMDLTAGASIP